MSQTTGDTVLRRAANQVEQKHDDGAITDSEAEAILQQKQIESGDLKPGTVGMHVRKLSIAAERASFDMTRPESPEQVNDLLRAMQRGQHPEVKDDGIIVKNYISALRKFYRAQDFGIDDGDIGVEEDYDGRELTTSDLLFKHDVDALLSVCQRESPRDMALIALGLATGQRVDAIRTLRLKHVQTDGPTMEIVLNDAEGSLKGASGRKPLLWAKHYVRPWYESHPFKDDPEAALFVPSTGSANPREPIKRGAVNRMLKRRAEQAGIEKEIYPHLLRHTAITRMVSEGLSEQAIKNIVGWNPDSSQFGTYVHISEQLATDTVREQLGMPTSDTGMPEIGRPTLDTCPSCNDELPDGTERCPTCQTALTTKEATHGEPDTKPSVDEITRSVQDMGTMDALEVVEALQDRLDEIQQRGRENMNPPGDMTAEEAVPDVDVQDAVMNQSEEQQRD